MSRIRIPLSNASSGTHLLPVLRAHTDVEGFVSVDLIADLACKYDRYFQRHVQVFESEDHALDSTLVQIIGHGPKAKGRALVTQLCLREVQKARRKAGNSIEIEQALYNRIHATASALYDQLRDEINAHGRPNVLKRVRTAAAVHAGRRAAEGLREEARNSKLHAPFSIAMRVTNAGELSPIHKKNKE